MDYLDMSGRQLDYDDFSRRVSIAPGMTRKVDVPAYEYRRSYSYYKSERSYSGEGQRFKVRFELKGYSSVGDEASTSSGAGPAYGEDDDEPGVSHGGNIMPVVTVLGVFLLILGIYVGLYVCVGIMAQRRGRSVPLWLIVSFFFTPLLAMVILLFVGDGQGRNSLD